jgi:hypothetical protein
LQRVDLKDLCESLLETFLDAATGKGLDLGLDVQPVHVTGHGWLLRELLSNLVDNAIKYTPAGGVVTIRCGVRRNAMNPCGCFCRWKTMAPVCPDAERGRVTQRFYRVPGTVGEGTGLGLAIADEIARVHHAAHTGNWQPGAGAGGGGGVPVRAAGCLSQSHRARRAPDARQTRARRVPGAPKGCARIISTHDLRPAQDRQKRSLPVQQALACGFLGISVSIPPLQHV